jgi:hypothetical protein
VASGSTPSDDDRESLRADLGVEAALVAGRNRVEGIDAVGDDAGEHIEPAGRALRIGGGGGSGRQSQALEQRHDIDATRLEHGTLGQIEDMQGEIAELDADILARAREKARSHPVCDIAQPQIDARRLDLARCQRLGGQKLAICRQATDGLRGQNAI